MKARKMIKICIITAARSEYGCLKWIISDIRDCDEFQLQLIVTGGHLSYEQGHTIDQIIEDGFLINYIVDSKLDTSSTARIAESMGRMAEGFTVAFEKIAPDYILILGDRYELLPICSTAFVMGIPIIHLSGGDVTEGAIDDGIRNAVTMLAEYHFPGTDEAARNIIRMRGTQKHIWTVGEPGLDAFNREKLLSREELARDIGLHVNTDWGLMTYHPETKRNVEYNLRNVRYCIEELLKNENLQMVITYANADFGGREINEYIEEQALLYPDKIRTIPSLGHRKYLSYLRQVKFMIGNSSSGIVEAPFMNIPVINIGDRQKGRFLCDNIIQCRGNKSEIRKAISNLDVIINRRHYNNYYWGDGHTSERIVEILKGVLKA